MCFRADGRIRRAERRATRRCVGMSGSEGSAESRRSSAVSAQIRHSSRSATMFFGPILPGERPAIRRISPPASIRCCRTRHAGFSPPISTRSPGSRMSPRSATPRGQKASPSPSNDRARATVLMRGFSSRNPWRRLMRGASGRSSSRQRWIAAPISASIRMIGSFRARTRCHAGGFGNLIALPLQSRPRENGNSVFVDDDFRPYEDQWAYLSKIGRLSRSELLSIVAEAAAAGQIIGVRLPSTDEDDEPWAALPSRRSKEPPIEGALPELGRGRAGQSGLHRPVEAPAGPGEPHRTAGRIPEP